MPRPLRLFAHRSLAGFLALLFMGGGASIRAAEPAPVSPATAEDLVERLARDETQGRNNLTDGSARARAILVDWMTSRGLEPAGTDGYLQPFSQGTNVIGVLRPVGAATRAPVVLIGAHYDHLGTSCRERPESASLICNGATDNAGGVAAALTAVEALAGRLGEPIAVALWDAEEDGLLGSRFFAENPSFDRSRLRLYLNLDIVGLHLFRGVEMLHFAVGAETGGPDLIADVIDSGAGSDLDFGVVSYIFGMGRSDQDSFVEAGWELPFVFMGDGGGSVYHTTADELQWIDLDKISAAAQVAAHLTARVADRGEAYPWVDPLSDGLLPVWEDAAVLLHVNEQVLRHVRDNGMTPRQTGILLHYAMVLSRIVDAGPQSFSEGDALQIVAAVSYGLELSQALPLVP